MCSKVKRLKSRRSGGPGRLTLPLLLILTSPWVLPAYALAEGQDSAAAVAAPQAPREHRESRLDARIKTLSRALDLDAGQQAELRKLLERQREQINRVWSDASMPAAYRVGATHAINDKTADEIRALLNEEQKKKYNPPRPPRQAPDASSRTVEEWMKATSRP
jgi:septal ring factor EnvC (AmiA/AmiB activator)